MMHGLRKLNHIQRYEGGCPVFCNPMMFVQLLAPGLISRMCGLIEPTSIISPVEPLVKVVLDDNGRPTGISIACSLTNKKRWEGGYIHDRRVA